MITGQARICHAQKVLLDAEHLLEGRTLLRYGRSVLLHGAEGCLIPVLHGLEVLSQQAQDVDGRDFHC